MQPLTSPGEQRDTDQCIENCLSCYHECLRTLPYCIERTGKHVQPEHIKALELCAEACRTTAEFMLLNSEGHGRVCSACGEVCERCAETCEGLRGELQMGRCASACRRCAECCRSMAAA